MGSPSPLRPSGEDVPSPSKSSKVSVSSLRSISGGPAASSAASAPAASAASASPCRPPSRHFLSSVQPGNRRILYFKRSFLSSGSMALNPNFCSQNSLISPSAGSTRWVTPILLSMACSSRIVRVEWPLPLWAKGTAMNGISAQPGEKMRTVATQRTSGSPPFSLLRLRTKVLNPVKSWGPHCFARTMSGSMFFCVRASFIGRKHSDMTLVHRLISLFLCSCSSCFVSRAKAASLEARPSSNRVDSPFSSSPPPELPPRGLSPAAQTSRHRLLSARHSSPQYQSPRGSCLTWRQPA
mmetsp:Transcript_1573/g.5372  ORF Transcript_1573/g.5372 Transcript_1573/m.5372 type:complete len:296 (-) Transcript_1573:1312-2199(-)